jgi:hypothetical protein
VTALVDLRRRVRQRMGVPASDDFFTDQVLNDAINEAIGTVETEHNWPWAERVEQTTAVNGVLTKSARWSTTRGLFTPAGDELRLVSLSDLLSVGGATGSPQVYADSGTDILIAPISNAALVHVYYEAPVDLVLDTDEPDLPDSMAGAVISKAAELLSAREDDQAARQAHAKDYDKWVQRMLASQRNTTGPLRVRVRPGGWI